ncbi:plasmid mobilization protein [Dyadobacter sp. OTU695]|uniref:plasmid mobilization protein n=1 Tax=Dyadobacter sp. OTU695 TaxID=3043860 RepID=UPI00313B0CF1
MKNQIKKGRPPKERGAAKREHFSVWVSSDQKSQINQLIEKSGLSASQYFLSLALDVPLKRPQKRTLPKATAETIRILEQLAGILSLAILKTKDHQMLSTQWQQSSQRVRLLADLITRWVFESFEIRTFQKTLTETGSWITSLSDYLSQVLGAGESNEQLLREAGGIARSARELLSKYESYYAAPLQELAPTWKNEAADIASVHFEIENAVREFIKQTSK